MNKENTKRLCFYFQGVSRTDLFDDYKKGKVPDSSLFGYNHLSLEKDLDVSLFESEKQQQNIFLKKYSQVRNSVSTFKKFQKYDAVVSSVGIPFILVQAFLFRKSPKWFLLNLNLTTVFRKHAGHPLKKFLLKYALNHTTKILCISFDQKKVLEREGISSEKIDVIYFGVDKKFFSPQKNKIHTEGYALSVGRDDGRDFTTLIKAAQHIDRKVVIVTSPANIANIKNIPPNVELRYNISYEEVKLLYQGADVVLVITHSDEYENGSDCSGQMTILDAMACGKAVIATKKGWMEDYFVNEEHLFTVPPYDERAISTIVKMILSQQDKGEKMGMRARALIEEKLNTEVMSGSFLSIIKNS